MRVVCRCANQICVCRSPASRQPNTTEEQKKKMIKYKFVTIGLRLPSVHADVRISQKAISEEWWRKRSRTKWNKNRFANFGVLANNCHHLNTISHVSRCVHILVLFDICVGWYGSVRCACHRETILSKSQVSWRNVWVSSICISVEICVVDRWKLYEYVRALACGCLQTRDWKIIKNIKTETKFEPFERRNINYEMAKEPNMCTECVLATVASFAAS